jgi:succinyl-diaminopimelate desuccinylase
MHEQFLKDLIGLLNLRSVYDASTRQAGQPYGAGVAQALAYMKALAERDGFEVLSYEGHAIAIVHGQAAKRIDVVSHLDVVDVSDAWDVEPFAGTIINETLYGRGTQDMKSAALLTYYALKEIRDLKLELNHQIRVVLGADEERTMKDLEHYIAHAGQPEYAFTPDGAFPILHAEKGALMWALADHFEHEGFSLEGGTQANVVAPNCTVFVENVDEALLRKCVEALELKAKIHSLDEGHRVEIEGIAAHASTPEKGRNAIVDGLALLAKLFPHHPKLTQLWQIFRDVSGSYADLACFDELLGTLSLNLGTLRIEHQSIKGLIDVRYPSTKTSAQLTEAMTKALQGLRMSLDYDAPPVVIDLESPYVQACLQAYRKHTQDVDTPPYVSGGVTYCKVIERCVAFGIHFPGDVSLAHQRNESIPLKRLEQAYPILRDAMIQMARVKDIP